MTAFLKIDRCRECTRELPWEWVPPVTLGTKRLAGTGVWRSRLLEGICPACSAAVEANGERERRSQRVSEHLIRSLGIKPYREFTFERYEVSTGNERAFQTAKGFDPSKDNLYLWGRGGVGKTHLAYAVARRFGVEGRSIAVLTPAQLIRKLRMKSPDEEQQGIDGFVNVEILVLDDLGIGSDTAYARQVLQEILDARDFRDRAGLLVTSRYSLTALAARLNDDTIPSRLAGMCEVVELRGADRRWTGRSGAQKSG